mgnify:CR=1 FL=1
MIEQYEEFVVEEKSEYTLLDLANAIEHQRWSKFLGNFIINKIKTFSDLETKEV